MNQKLSNFLRWFELICLVAVIVVLAIFLIEVKSDGAVCMANPLIYGAKEMSRINSDEFSCSCSFASNQIKPLSFNSSTLFYTPPIIVYSNEYINYNSSWGEIINSTGFK